jgi:hypothetical protein
VSLLFGRSIDGSLMLNRLGRGMQESCGPPDRPRTRNKMAALAGRCSNFLRGRLAGFEWKAAPGGNDTEVRSRLHVHLPQQRLIGRVRSQGIVPRLSLE